MHSEEHSSGAGWPPVLRAFSRARLRCRAAGATTRPELCRRVRPADLRCRPSNTSTSEVVSIPAGVVAEGTARLSGDENFRTERTHRGLVMRRSEWRHFRGRRAWPGRSACCGHRPAASSAPIACSRQASTARSESPFTTVGRESPTPLMCSGRKQPGDPLSLCGGRYGSPLQRASGRAQPAGGRWPCPAAGTGPGTSRSRPVRKPCTSRSAPIPTSRRGAEDETDRAAILAQPGQEQTAEALFGIRGAERQV